MKWASVIVRPSPDSKLFMMLANDGTSPDVTSRKRRSNNGGPLPDTMSSNVGGMRRETRPSSDLRSLGERSGNAASPFGACAQAAQKWRAVNVFVGLWLCGHRVLKAKAHNERHYMHAEPSRTSSAAACDGPNIQCAKSGTHGMRSVLSKRPA